MMTRLLALIVAPLVGCAAALVWFAPSWFTPQFEFGFRARYVPHPEHPGDACGPTNGGLTSQPWSFGPHAHFERFGTKQLASESLAWFTRSSAAEEWRHRSTARLELVYPGASFRVTARYTPESDLSWNEQLQAWFERFPPHTADAAGADGEPYSWNIDFKEFGRIEGSAASESAALDHMQGLVADRAAFPPFEDPVFHLAAHVRRSPHVMDVYTVDAGAEQIDDLPRLLREKREKYRSIVERREGSGAH